MSVFGKLVHIFGELVNIFGNLVHTFAWKLVSRTLKQVSRNLGHYCNRGFTMILKQIAQQVVGRGFPGDSTGDQRSPTGGGVQRGSKPGGGGFGRVFGGG